MSEIKLKVNLEDLISLLCKDKDNNIRIDISQQIADEFAKRHLKSLIHDENIRRIAEHFREITKKECIKLFEEQIADIKQGKNSYGTTINYYQLKPELVQSIKDNVKYSIDDAVIKLATEYYNQRAATLENLVTNRISSYIATSINGRINKAVEAELAKLEVSIEQRVQDIVNKIGISITK